jgi:energy-coupling factor transporter ATP-binding protein EcfA2
MIYRAKFQNFKALRDVEVTFDSRLTVLVGPNGSGKSSVLEAIYQLCQGALVGTYPHGFHPGQGVLIGSNPQGFNPAALAECVSSGASLTQLRLEAIAKGPKDVEYEVLVAPPVKTPNQPHPFHHLPLVCTLTQRSGGSSKVWLNQPPPLEVTDPFRPATLLRLDAAKLAAASQPSSLPPVMQSDGAGLASALAYLALNQPERFQEIVTAFKQVIPIVNRIRFDKVQITGFGDLLLFDFRGAPGVKAAFVSQGTLFALGLLTVILGPQRPRIVLLDDLDHGLHPKAQMELVDVLRKLLDQYSDLQIIATSHSPYILDRLEPREVRMMALKDHGSAVCAPLTSHPEFERWKEAMSPGEFWSTFYEDWLTRKPEPQPAR